jgi:hypothetical protein
MQELETENNRLFIAAYGLSDELRPDVPEEQITLARADARRDMAAFLSYAVGCMMGRHSLDQPGLVLDNSGDSMREFLEKVGRPQDHRSAKTFASTSFLISTVIIFKPTRDVPFTGSSPAAKREHSKRWCTCTATMMERCPGCGRNTL